MGVQSSAKTATPASTSSFFFTATAEVGEEEEEEEDGGGFPTEKESHTMQGLSLFSLKAHRVHSTLSCPAGRERKSWC